MKLDVIPEGILETIGNAAGVVPGPVVRVLFGVAVTRIVLPAMKLGVFEAIGEGERTPEEVAKTIGCDPEGTRVLLAALNGFGYLRRRSGRYRLSKDSRKWILATSKTSLRPALEFANTLDDMMGGIERAVRTGERGGLHEQPHSPEWWRQYMEGLGAVARLTGAEITRRVNVKTPAGAPPERLLDVAGGHGGHAMAFCKRYPAMEATVLDLPQAAAVGKELVAKAGMAERVRYVEGDLRTTPWGEGYDVVLLFNILHNLREADVRETLKKARAALKPGGAIVIFDGEHAGKDGDLNSAEGFGELFFFVVSASSVWPDTTLRAWLEGAGFADVKRMKLFSFPSSLMLVARAPQRPILTQGAPTVGA